MMTKTNLIILSLICLALLAGQSLAALAQTTSTPEAPINLENPITVNGTPTTNVSLIIGNIISWILRFLGVLALVMFIYGGMLWMTSGGKAEQITKGKDTLVWAVAGLALVFFSYAILTFVFKVLINKQP